VIRFDKCTKEEETAAKNISIDCVEKVQTFTNYPPLDRLGLHTCSIENARPKIY